MQPQAKRTLQSEDSSSKRPRISHGSGSQGSSSPSILVPNSQATDDQAIPTHPSYIFERNLRQLYPHGLAALVEAMYEFELERNHPLAQRHKLDHWLRFGVTFLAAIPDQIILGLINGNLASRYAMGNRDLVKLFGEPSSGDDSQSSEEENASLRDTPYWQMNSLRVSPGHYVRYLVTPGRGQAATPNQLFEIIKLMRKYASSAPYNVKLATAIDSARGKHRSASDAQLQAGKFYYICSRSRSRVQARVTAIQAFSDALEERLKLVPDQIRDEPDRRALAYVGYAAQISRHSKEHDEEDTSCIMALIEATVSYLKLNLQWETFTTSFAVCFEECELGKCLINGLAQAYHNTGVGVAPAPAGISCHSAQFKGKSADQVQKLWDEAVGFRYRQTPFQLHMENEAKLFKQAQGDADLPKKKFETESASVLALLPSKERMAKLQSLKLASSRKPIAESITKRFASFEEGVRKAEEIQAHIKGQFDSICEEFDKLR